MSEDTMLLVEVHLDQGHPDRAWEAITPLLAERPGDPTLQLLAARAALASGRPKEALQLVEASLGRRPAEAGAHSLRALALARLRRKRAAVAAAQQAVALRPLEWRMHAAVVAVDLAGRGVTRRTRSAVVEVLRLAPQDPDAQHLAGVVAAVRSRRNQARFHYQAALALDPGHEGARDGLARLGLGRLDLRGGVTTASSLLAASPGDDLGMDLLRATWHRAVWLLCLAPLAVSQISRILVESDRGDLRTAAEARPVVLLLLLLLIPAIAAWLWFVNRSVPGGLGRLARILPVTHPATLVWAGCAAVGIALCAVAAGQPVSVAPGFYSAAAALSILPGILLVALEQRRIRRR